MERMDFSNDSSPLSKMGENGICEAPWVDFGLVGHLLGFPCLMVVCGVDEGRIVCSVVVLLRMSSVTMKGL